MEGQHVEELKELVKVSLQQAGVLGTIKAQLRAAVFKVVNQEEGAPNDGAGGKASQVMATNEGALAVDLVREFLEYYELQNSLAVLVPEAQLDKDSFPGRSALASRLDLANGQSRPLLVELLAAHMSRNKSSLVGRTPSPADAENVRPGEGGSGSNASPSSSKAAGGAATKPGVGSSLGDLPGLPGVNKTTVSTAGVFGSSAIYDDGEGDEELSSTTRRIRNGAAKDISPAKVGRESSSSSPAGSNLSSPNKDKSLESGDASMETRKQQMLKGAESAEKAMLRAGGDEALDMSDDDDIGSDDIVDEEIEPESDLDEPPSPSHVAVMGSSGGAGGHSLSESANEMSISDRSVDGSMALEGFDHIEPVGGQSH